MYFRHFALTSRDTRLRVEAFSCLFRISRSTRRDPDGSSSLLSGHKVVDNVRKDTSMIASLDCSFVLLTRPANYGRFIALAVLAPILMVGCARTELSEKPPNSASKPSFPTRESTISAEGVVPLASLTDAVNSKIPKQFSKSGNGDDLCANVPGIGDLIDILTGRRGSARVCVGTQYEFNAKAGTVSVAAVNPSTVRISAPISFSGTGGFRGDGCRLLSCSAKNFNGGALIQIDVSPTVDQAWCPKLNASVSYNWTSNPRVEIVGGVWVDVSGQVSGELNKQIENIKNAINATVDCSMIKQELSKVYGSRAFPVAIPGSPPAVVNVQPTGFGLSALSVEPDKLRLSAQITAKVDVADKPIAVGPLPLPPMQQLPAGTPLMTVALPVRVSYEVLRTALGVSLEGKSFTGDTALGKATVTVKRVEVYPSGERLVIGLKVAADLPSKWFDVSGDVYLLAKPVVDTPTKLRLAEIGFARKLDSPFWEVATAVFEKQIIAKITEVGHYDLTRDIDSAKTALNKALQDAGSTPGVTVTLSDISMGIGRIAVASTELAVEGVFSAKTTVTAKP